MLKVAVIGAGYFSQFHYDAWARCPEVELVGVCDQNIEAARTAAGPFLAPAFESPEQMLDQISPDLMDIITPPDTHLSIIKLAAERNCDAICQKPFGGDLETARTATDLAQKAGIKLIVHENFRFQPWYPAVRKELELGRLGQVYQATFRLRPGDGQGPDAYLDRQPYFRTMERFVVHETAIHYVDVFRYLLGDVTSVFADLQRLNPAIAGEDKCLIITEHQRGVRALIDGNRLSDHSATNLRRTMGELVIEGENGVLTLDGEAQLHFRQHGSQESKLVLYDWKDNGFGGDCVYRFTRHVVEHFVGGDELSNTAAEYLTNLEIEEAIYASAKKGLKIRM